MEDISLEHMKTAPNIKISPVEIELGNFLNINTNLTPEQNKMLLQLL